MYRRHRLAAFSFGVTVPTFGASMSPPFHPCIPTRAPQPPSRGRWVHEIKQGGYRLIVRRVGEHVSLRTKGGYDWAERYPRIARSVLKLRVESVALDGEGDGPAIFEAACQLGLEGIVSKRGRQCLQGRPIQDVAQDQEP